MMQNEPIGITLKVTRILEELGIRYFIGGSLASTLHGMVRMTQDSDIVAEMSAVQVQMFSAALQDEFYVDELMVADAIRQCSSFNIIHKETMFKVDVFIPRPRLFLESQFGRARWQILDQASNIGGIFLSPEDTILSKLEWYRLGNEMSERQWRDVLGILMMNTDRIDRVYLRKWAAELHVGDLLDRALMEADASQ
jgi:hypothetical protein